MRATYVRKPLKRPSILMKDDQEIVKRIRKYIEKQNPIVEEKIEQMIRRLESPKKDTTESFYK